MTQKDTGVRAVHSQKYKVKPSPAPPFWLRGHYWQARKCKASTTFNVRISNPIKWCSLHHMHCQCRLSHSINNPHTLAPGLVFLLGNLFCQKKLLRKKLLFLQKVFSSRPSKSYKNSFVLQECICRKEIFTLFKNAFFYKRLCSLAEKFRYVVFDGLPSTVS